VNESGPEDKQRIINVQGEEEDPGEEYNLLEYNAV
jgi:hypothetical protein